MKLDATTVPGRCSFCRILALSQVVASIAVAEPTGTAFTYRAQLKQDGIPLNGDIDVTLELFDAETNGNSLGFRSFPAVEAVNGQFSVEVDFGAAAFTGDARWIQAAVRSPHDPTNLAPFTTLEPRQRINTVPYATHALNAEHQNSLDAPSGGPTDAVFVDQNGNVGIGTTAPLGRLHVHGTNPSGQTTRFVDQAQHRFFTPLSELDCGGQQSFVAGASGKLVQVRVKLFQNVALSTRALRILAPGPAGPELIAQVSGELQGAKFDEVGLTFSESNAPWIEAGNTYYFEYVPPAGFLLCADEDTAYPPGQGGCFGGSEGGFPADLWFETVLQTEDPPGDVVVDTSGRVGIGTFHPAGKLHVVNDFDQLDQAQYGMGFEISRADTTWQSFLAGRSGRLSAVRVKLAIDVLPAPMTVRIYAGQGTAGTLLAEALGVPFAGATGDVVTLALPDAIAPAITAGQSYTFQGVFPPRTDLYAEHNNPYPNGSLAETQDDLWFETYVAGPDGGLVYAPNGHLGVGTATPACKLSVVGDACAQSFLEASDARFKQNIEPLDGALDILSELTGVRFDWRNSEFADRRFPDGRQLGFIAQDVEKVLPEVVVRDADGYFAIDYGRLTPVLVQALRELKAQSDARQSNRDRRLTELEEQNLRLQTRLDQLEQRLKPSPTP